MHGRRFRGEGRESEGVRGLTILNLWGYVEGSIAVTESESALKEG